MIDVPGSDCSNCGSRLIPQPIEGRIRGVCPDCSLVAYEQRKLSAAVRIVKDGRLLLVQRGIEPWYGSWHLPSGYVEVDEEPETAAQREALEETGLIVKVGGLVDYYTYDDDPRGNGIILLFDAFPLEGEFSANDETLALGYFSPEEIDRIPLAGMSARNMIADWLANVKG